MLLKELVTEGTWAAPQTLEQAQELAELMSNPIPAKTISVFSKYTNAYVSSILYHLMGNDQLFDNIDRAFQRDPEEDIRPLVFNKLKEWLLTAKEDIQKDATWRGPEGSRGLRHWTERWDPEAIKLLRRLIRMRV